MVDQLQRVFGETPSLDTRHAHFYRIAEYSGAGELNGVLVTAVRNRRGGCFGCACKADCHHGLYGIDFIDNFCAPVINLDFLSKTIWQLAHPTRRIPHG